MASIVLKGFENLNKVKLDKGFKTLLGIGLKQGMEMTEQLLREHSLLITDLTDDQITGFMQLAKDSNASIEVL